jgi:hypothetical protein
MTTRETLTEYLRDIHAATADMATLKLREERRAAESLTECLEETVQLAVAG